MVDVTYKKTPLYDTLTDEYAIFEHYYDVMVFLAVLGFRADEIETDDYRGSDEQRGSIGIERFYGNDRYHAIVAALAYQQTNDPSAMADPAIHREVIAQYAAGGLRVYQDAIGDVAGDPTDAIANYVKSCIDETHTSPDDELQTIIQNFDKEMLE